MLRLCDWRAVFAIIVLASLHSSVAEEIMLPEVVATAVDLDGYFLPDSTTATRLAVPTLDVPQSVEVRGRKLIEDLGGAQRADAVSRTVAGVVQVGNLGNGGTNIPVLTMRGFGNHGVSLQDGYYRFAGDFMVTDMASVERVEFLKGPPSVLIGATGSLGGILNYISKRPTLHRQFEADLTVGSYDFYRSTLDMGGQLGPDAVASYRLNGAFEEGKTFRDFAWHQTEFIAPALTLQVSPDDRVTILTQYLHMDARQDFGLPGTPLYARVPVRKYFQEPGFDQQHYHGVNGAVEYTHDFSEDWHLRIGYSANQTDWHQNYTLISINEDDPLLVDRAPAFEHIGIIEQHAGIWLTGRFDTWRINHQVVLGFDAARVDGHFDGKFGSLPSMSLFGKPVYGSKVNFFAGALLDEHIEGFAPSVEDLITLTPFLKLMAGARYDRLRSSQNFSMDPDILELSDQTDLKLTSRLGVVIEPWKTTSLYFTHATSFTPNIGRARTGQLFDPEQGEMWEGGVKYELNSRFAAHLSVYRISKQHVLTADPVSPFFDVETGEQRSSGFEMDVNGQITDAFRLNLAYAYTEARVFKDTVTPVGTRLIGTPRNSFNLFGVYALTGRLRGLEIGAGLYYASAMEVSEPNTFRTPPVAEIDAMIAYRFSEHFRLQFDVMNVADRQNYTSDRGFIAPSSPRSLFVKASLSF